jgi:antitoxin component YwqK of YwqJK toxin-antitoxin module
MTQLIITGYKKANDNKLVILDIPSESIHNLNRTNIVDKQFAKYRCSYAIIKEIIDLKTNQKINEAQSMYDKNFKYYVDQKVVPNTFDTNLENVCSSGIHFFLDKYRAELYEQILTNGEYKEWHENGQLIKHYFYKDDKFDGEYKDWHSNGQLYIHCFYKDGKLDGEYKEWHDNGQLIKHHFYKDDKFDGECKDWHSNGQLYIHCFYKDGKLNEEYYQWYSNGQLSKHCFYNNGNLY